MSNDFGGYNPQKDRVRHEVLDVVRDSSSMLWDGSRNKLNVHWAGLAGMSAHEFRMLLDVGCLNPHKYLGFDLDWETLEACRKTFAEEEAQGLCVWRSGDVITWARNFTRNPGDWERLGVLVYDSMSRFNNSRWGEHLDTLVALGEAQQKRVGEFVLAVNFTDHHVPLPEREGYSEKLQTMLARHGFQPGTKSTIQYPGKSGHGSMWFSILTFGFEDNRMFR